MGAPARFATQGQAKAEGYFSRRHRNGDAHSAARDVRRDRESRKEALAERGKNAKRTTPRFEKVGDGLFKHVDNGHTYKVDKTISRKEVEIPENTQMARRLRREVAKA